MDQLRRSARRAGITGVASVDAYGPRLVTPNGALRLLPRTTVRVGFGDAERRAAEGIDVAPNLSYGELLPAQGAVVGPLLVAEFPFLDSDAAAPAMLTLVEAQARAVRAGGRLPTEIEWEAVVRAGTGSLFCWGDEVPAEDELEPMLSWNLAADSWRNRWGIGGVFFGEWTADRWGGGDEEA